MGLPKCQSQSVGAEGKWGESEKNSVVRAEATKTTEEEKSGNRGRVYILCKKNKVIHSTHRGGGGRRKGTKGKKEEEELQFL